MSNKHLFIICMNNAGSTLLHHYLSDCRKVVSLPRMIPDRATSSEGHNHVRGLMPYPGEHDVVGVWTERPDLFEGKENYNWEEIKEKWMTGWKGMSDGPIKDMVLLEKSPPNVARAKLLQDNFPNSYFIIMVRNPYAVSEGLRRRQGHHIQRCAKHCGEVFRLQLRNLKVLKNVIWFKYSDLCSRQQYVKDKIINFLPELDDLSFDKDLVGHHSVFGKKVMSIKNLNAKQIKNLGRNDFIIINNILSNYEKELRAFGYADRFWKW